MIARLVSAVLLLAVAVGCGNTDPGGDMGGESVPRDVVRDGGTLHLAVAELPESFNPFLTPPWSSVHEVLAPTRGSAIEVADDGTWSSDRLYAESVDVVSTDPLAVVVRLNPDAVWSDGSSIDVSDMQAFVAAQQGAGGTQPAATGAWSQVASVEQGVDVHEYTVTFSEPIADWPAYVYPGLSAEASDASVYNGFTDAAPVSNGPFHVVGIDRDAGTVQLEPHPHWWGDAPALDGIMWTAQDAPDRVASFIAGDLDALQVERGMLQAIGDAGTITHSPGTDWSQITLNAGRGPLTQLPVRQAIAMAIDREDFAEQTSRAFGSEAPPLGSLVMVPGQAGYTDTAGTALPHDPDAATELLLSAGYVRSGEQMIGPDGSPLTLTMPVPEGNTATRERADLVAESLAQIGVAVEIVERPAETFFNDVVVSLDFDLVTFLWSVRPFGLAAAAARLAPLDSPQNFTGQSDPAVGAAAGALRLALDPAAVPDAAAALDAAAFAAATIIPLASEPHVLAVGDDVVNLEARQFGLTDWASVGFRE